MKDMEKIITGILIIVCLSLLGWTNCCKATTCSEDCVKVCCEANQECGGDCAKACCLGCHATEGDVKCLDDHSCCVVETEDEDKDTTVTENEDTTVTENEIIEEDL